MSIFILEDHILQAQNLRNTIEEICHKHQLTYDFIEVTSRGEEIIQKIPHTTLIPIYFLDIEIKSEEKKGLEIAQEIRKHDPDGIIVFVTTHSELSPISYKYMVSAYTFIDKGLPYEERYHLLEKCLLYYQTRNKTLQPRDDLVIENNHAIIRVPFHEVEYIMTDGPHRLALVTKNRIIHFYGTLREIEDLDERLIRCHQSYIVNKESIMSFERKDRLLEVKSGKRIPVSRRYVRQVRQLLKGE